MPVSLMHLTTAPGLTSAALLQHNVNAIDGHRDALRGEIGPRDGQLELPHSHVMDAHTLPEIGR